MSLFPVCDFVARDRSEILSPPLVCIGGMRMSVEESRQVYAVDRIEAGELTVAEAAAALGLSRRRTKRLRKKVREGGLGAIVHGNAGRAPWHKRSPGIRDQIVQLWRST
jgi:hypothetical protein